MDIALHVPLAQLTQLKSQPATPGEEPATPVQRAVQAALENKYGLVCLPLTTDKWKTRWQEMCLAPSTDEPTSRRDPSLEDRAERWRSGEGFQRDEVTMTRLDEAESVIAMASDWLELDSIDEGVRYDSELALRQEIAYATYLNIQTIMLPPPRNREHTADYARAVNACLAANSFFQISVRIPILDLAALRSGTECSMPLAPSGTLSPRPSAVSVHSRALPGELSATWEMWDVIRAACSYNPRLSISLDLTPPLPTSLSTLARWTAEPTRYVFLPASAFVPNAKGYPVLTKATQSFLRDLVKHRPTIILSCTQSGLHANGGELAYAQYVRHVENTSPTLLATETPGTIEYFAKGYVDYLQAPLQPLMDNLPSVTYEVFEKDPVKYHQYEQAVFKALSDRPVDATTVICVAGAGRGPLVTNCLRAIERSGRKAKVYAIEKNVNAFVTLQDKRESQWGGSVKIIQGDMRSIRLPEKIDILVSELLGSFGDNELSPECLDGAMRFLKPDGISIPASYTAHLAPLSSSKLFNEVNSATDKKFAETPYVVLFQAVNILSGDGGGIRGKCGGRVQECWEFEHPRRDTPLDPQGLPWSNSHNTRSASLNFHIPHAGVLHGFAGYFEAVLYGDIGLSIHPERKDRISANMFSWFPLFIPLKEPLYLPSNAELQVSIWRLTDKRKVWYEWLAEVFLPGAAAPSPPWSTNGHAGVSSSTLLSPTFGGLPAPSPLLDAPTLGGPWSSSDGDRSGPPTPRMSLDPAPAIAADTRIKIGQTALHNPGGRSSWIGL